MALKKLAEVPVKLHFHKGDEVEVIGGKDRGKRGKILRAYPSVNKVLVDGLNLIIKHQKARQTGRQTRQGTNEIQESGRITKPAPLYAPKVMLVCPHCTRPTRVGYSFVEGVGKLSRRKRRVCKHPECGKIIE